MEPIALLPTCVIEALAPEIGMAVVRALRRNGWEPRVPDGVTCCGQPGWNTGAVSEAARVAATTLDALAHDPAERICVPAGSCATMMRVYWPELFAEMGDDERVSAAQRVAERVVELTELLDAIPDDGPPGDGLRVAYHRSCHMTRELHLRDEPHRVLERDGHTIVDWPDDDRCCGFGGMFSVKQPEISVAMADDKLRSLPVDDVDVLAGADLSCLLQLEGRLRALGIDLPVRHVAELLDR